MLIENAGVPQIIWSISLWLVTFFFAIKKTSWKSYLNLSFCNAASFTSHIFNEMEFFPVEVQGKPELRICCRFPGAGQRESGALEAMLRCLIQKGLCRGIVSCSAAA